MSNVPHNSQPNENPEVRPQGPECDSLTPPRGSAPELDSAPEPDRAALVDPTVSDLPLSVPPVSEPATESTVTDASPAEEPAPAPDAATPPAPTPVGPSIWAIQSGKVIRVTSQEILLQLDGDRQGSVPIEEFLGQPLPRAGDEVGVVVVREDADTGQIVLSKRQADEASFWHAVRPGDYLEGVVTGMNKGGLDIDIGGARAFLPASQVDIRRVKDISVLIGEHVKCMVTQVDPTTRDLVVSRRKVMDKERKERRLEALNTLTEGENRKGTVRNITDFGAFVDIGGIEGLLHVTDMSWGRIRHPSEVVQSGQEIEVRILKVDHSSGKVSVGLKQAQPDPWSQVESKYPAGARVKGKVLRFADFGAFVELEEGVEALLPISEMSWTKRINHPSELLQLGQDTETVVLRTDAGKRRISLGLRQTEENPWEKIDTLFPVNTTQKGKVVKIMEFGAFVELLPGIEGLVHISELSDRRVKSVDSVVKEGQEIEVRVLKLDKEQQRISLSMRPPPREEPEDAPAEAKPKSKKARPLRGGLSSHFDW